MRRRKTPLADRTAHAGPRVVGLRGADLLATRSQELADGLCLLIRNFRKSRHATGSRSNMPLSRPPDAANGLMAALYIGVVMAFPDGLAGLYESHVKSRIASVLRRVNRNSRRRSTLGSP